MGYNGMDCEDVRPHLALYPDVDEPMGLRDGIAAHLDACPSCASEARRLTSAWGLLEALDGVSPPADFPARVRARLGASRLRRLRWFPAAAAAALLLGAAALLIPLPHNPPADAPLPELPPAEIEIVQHLDLLENLEVVETFDFLLAGAAIDQADSFLDVVPQEY